MQLTALWGDEEAAVELSAECRTLAALESLLQDAFPKVELEKVCLEVDGQQLTADDDVCGLEAGMVIKLSATAAALATATLREEGHRLDFRGLCEATRDGDVRLCRLYLDVVLHCTRGQGNILPGACMYQRTEIVRLLLERGFAVDEANYLGSIPLHAACQWSNDAIVALLIDYGSDIEATNGVGDTPLHIACSSNHVGNVRLLLDRGCAMHKSNNAGTTALYSACDSNSVAIVELLLDRGCPVDADSLEVAQMKGHATVSELLSRERTASLDDVVVSF